MKKEEADALLEDISLSMFKLVDKKTGAETHVVDWDAVARQIRLRIEK